MKVCFTSLKGDVEDNVFPKFGRCKYFVIVDLSQDKKVEVLENPYREEVKGAGVQAARFILNQGVKRVYTGNLGPGAEKVLRAAGVEIVKTGDKIKNILEKL